MIEEIQVTLEDKVLNAEGVKCLVINSLVNQDLISKEAGDEFIKTNAIILVKQSWYKHIFNGADNWIYKCVKM